MKRWAVYINGVVLASQKQSKVEQLKFFSSGLQERNMDSPMELNKLRQQLTVDIVAFLGRKLVRSIEEKMALKRKLEVCQEENKVHWEGNTYRLIKVSTSHLFSFQ